MEKMNKEQKEAFGFGLTTGIVVGVLAIWIVVLIISIGHKELRYDPNFLLNSNNWKIDTVTTIIGKDTTRTYKFSEIHEKK